MSRFGSSIVALVVVLTLGSARSAGAQELAAADAGQGPRFLLASASRLVRLDVDRTPLLARRLELSLEGVTLKQALAEIARRAGLRLAFSDNDVLLERRVHLRADAITVAAALTDVLLGTGVDVVFGSDGGASLVKRSAAALAQPGRVVGQVTDQDRNQGIAGAEVLLEGTQWRTLTGQDGRYALAEVAPGPYTITARRIGYLKRSEAVTVGDGQEVVADFALQPAPTTLSEVVVRAQKREERLIDVPQSVSVLSADDLAKTGALQFRDFANTVPGLSFTTAGAGYTQVSLRGVTTGLDIGGPTVGVYVDDVPYGSSTGFAQGSQSALDVGLFDIDRIEVLRGPQGTLYGASTMGGLLKYVSKRPDATGFGVDAQAGTSGTHDGGISSNGSIAVNAPIVTDRMALRANAFYSHDGGYIDNVAGTQAGGQKNVNRSGIYGGRADLLFTPTEVVSIRLTGFLQNISRDGEGTSDHTFAGAPLYGTLDQRRVLPEPFDQRFRLVSGTATYDLRRANLTSISSYQTIRTNYVADISAVYVPLLATCPPICRSYSAVAWAVDLATDKFTQEVRLASEGAQALEWLIGGFYTHETAGNEQAFPARDLAGQQAPNDLFVFSAPTRYEEYAGFGDLTWDLTSKFDVTGGIRYARNRQMFEQIGSGLFGVTVPTRRSSEDVFTYLGNARYYFNDHATAYLRYATGYRPGGPNFAVIDATTGLPVAPETFESDRLKSYEAGLKAETADRRLGLDLAGYYTDWSNIQILAIRGGFGAIANGRGASVLGVELALTAHPASALTVTGDFAYQDAEMSEADPDLGAAEGERLPNVPRFTAALKVDYNLPVESLQPAVGATLRHVGDRKASFDNSLFFPQYRLPDYTTVDLRTGLTLGSVAMQLYVRNLLDERGQLSLMLAQFGGRVAILQPRTIGISVTTHF